MNRRSEISWGLALAALLGLGVAACTKSLPAGPTTYSWTEDVLVDEGRTLRVKRSATIKETNSMSGDAYNAVEAQATIEFTGDLAQLPPWSAPLLAIVLYQDSASAEWAVVAKTSSCIVWRARGKPKPPYWEFRLRDGAWRESPLSTNSLGRKANLLRQYKRVPNSGHVTPELRRQLDSGSTVARMYREVYGDPDQYVCGDGDTNKLL